MGTQDISLLRVGGERGWVGGTWPGVPVGATEPLTGRSMSRQLLLAGGEPKQNRGSWRQNLSRHCINVFVTSLLKLPQIRKPRFPVSSYNEVFRFHSPPLPPPPSPLPPTRQRRLLGWKQPGTKVTSLKSPPRRQAQGSLGLCFPTCESYGTNGASQG